MEFWIDTDRSDLGYNIVQEIEYLTGIQHPEFDSANALPFIFKMLKNKDWVWHIETFDNSYVMTIHLNDDVRCFAQDIDLTRTIYLAYYDAIIYEYNK